MAYTLVFNPTYPEANQACTVALWESGAVKISSPRFMFTAIPAGSSLSTYKVFPRNVFTPDTAGLFHLRVFDEGFRSRNTTGDGYREAMSMGYCDGYVSVATPVVLNFDMFGKRFGLEFVTVFDNIESTTIKKTRFVNVTDSVVRNIAKLTATKSNMLNFVDTTIESGTVIPDLISDTETMIQGFNDHLGYSDCHAVGGDGYNVISPETITNVQGALNALNKLKRNIVLHESNNQNAFHASTDTKSVTFLADAIDKSSGLVLLSRLKKVYNNHLLDAVVHFGTADTFNPVSASDNFYDFINGVVDEFESDSISKATDENAGEIQLLNAGFSVARNTVQLVQIDENTVVEV